MQTSNVWLQDESLYDNALSWAWLPKIFVEAVLQFFVLLAQGLELLLPGADYVLQLVSLVLLKEEVVLHFCEKLQLRFLVVLLNL